MNNLYKLDSVRSVTMTEIDNYAKNHGVKFAVISESISEKTACLTMRFNNGNFAECWFSSFLYAKDFVCNRNNWGDFQLIETSGG